MSKERIRYQPEEACCNRWPAVSLSLLRALLASAVVLGALLLWVPSAAAYTFNVRSRTGLSMEVKQRGLRPLIEARLVDNVHQGLEDRPIELRIWGINPPRPMRLITVRTGRFGYLQYQLTLEPGSYRINLAFQGTGSYTASEVDHKLEVRRAEAELLAQLPTAIHLQPQVEVVFPIVLTLPFALTEPLGVELSGCGLEAQRLTLSSRPKSPRRLLAEGRIRPGGLRPGWCIFNLSLVENPFVGAPSLSEQVLIFNAPKLSFEAEVVDGRDFRGLHFGGEVNTDQGPPVKAKVVVQMSKGGRSWEVIATTQTDSAGAYEAYVDWESLPEGELSVRAALVPDAGPSLRTEAIQLKLDWSGMSGWALGFVGILMLLGGFFLVGRLVVELLRRWRSRQIKRTATLQGAGPSLDTELGSVIEAVSESDAIKGMVVDKVLRHPLAGVEVELVSRSGAPLAQSQTNSQGIFVMRSLAAGQAKLHLRAPGYISGSLSLRLPHSGQYAAFGVQLQSVRDRIREIYEWLLSGIDSREQLWGLRTPQELEAAVLEQLGQLLEAIHRVGAAELETQLKSRLSGSAGALVEIATRSVELVYFSDHLFDEEIAQLVEAIARSLRPELLDLRLTRRQLSPARAPIRRVVL